ncbi:hypothetical protein [Marinobacterium jannaschii]|uniref:hypothetical protein n=1 Tax=Marinobacterium jannaschii TaxID=64970 RepID=UPI0004883BF7|nr:hypothetical protein [Marinobacterium jannaschii]
MTYKTSRQATVKFLFEKLEQLIGLAGLFAVLVSVNWITPQLALILFVLVLALTAGKKWQELQRIRSLELKLDGPIMSFLYHGQEEDNIDLRQFHIALFKTSGGSIKEFKIYSDEQAIKVHHMEHMDQLFEEVLQSVPQRKLARWWQFL